MDFSLEQSEVSLKEDVRGFAEQEIPHNWIVNFLDEESRDEDWAFSLSISRKLAQKGWLVMNWSKKYVGCEASWVKYTVFAMAAAYYGIPGLSTGVSGTGWIGPSLMLYGNEGQRQRYLPEIASGSPDGIWKKSAGTSCPDHILPQWPWPHCLSWNMAMKYRSRCTCRRLRVEKKFGRWPRKKQMQATI